MSGATNLDARRELLVAQCELDRLELALAWHDLRRVLRPDTDPLHAARGHAWLGRVLGLVLPLLGVARARRMSRYVSLGLLVYRALTSLRRSRA